ncbi:hypothetical protein BN1723_012592 [Verticillium longisporum]|uniref:Uncharacterized protein n=1 Tax=Verticillium longisporum TaxID=100787 RepID=A0A0G4LJN5_VERLO|nr:hypothetical protein BN1723_012592 [Verticillium longisporum]
MSDTEHTTLRNPRGPSKLHLGTDAHATSRSSTTRNDTDFTGQDSLPLAIRLPGFRGTYADFLVQSIYNLITTSQGKLTAIYPALLAVINNIAAHLEGISHITASKLLQLFSSMSSPSFLLANDTNQALLRSLLESINSIIEHQYKNVTDDVAENPELIFAIVRNKKKIEALRSFTLESGQEEIERRNRRRKEAAGSGDGLEPSSVRSSVDSIQSPTVSQAQHPSLSNVPEEDDTFAIGDDEDDSDDDHQPTPARSTTSDSVSMASSQASNVEDAVPTQVRGMSEKARGKMPAGVGNFSRQNSTTSLGGYSASGGSTSGAFEPTPHWIESWLPELPLHTILTVIQQVSALLPRQTIANESASTETLQRIQEIQLVGVDPAPVRVHSFEWSQLALGWYESLVWSFVFSSEIQVARGTAGVWNGTAIKLFRVQETAAEGPTLTSPRGAVDAVGSNIVSRIGAMNIRGGAAGAAGVGTGGGGTGQTSASPRIP